jgi:hypothetical protein
MFAGLPLKCWRFVYSPAPISTIMGQVGGYVTIFVGLTFLLGAYGAYSEANELQIKHDTFCGGIMEAVLDWDGNCVELRQYISDLEIGALILGIVGISLIVSGNNEVKKSTDKDSSEIKGTKLKHYSTGKVVVKPFSVVETIQNSPAETNGFCGKCGTPFQFNSSDKFCTKCGNSR